MSDREPSELELFFVSLDAEYSALDLPVSGLSVDEIVRLVRADRG